MCLTNIAQHFVYLSFLLFCVAALRLRLKVSCDLARNADNDSDSSLGSRTLSAQDTASSKGGCDVEAATEFPFLSMCNCVRYAIRANWSDDLDDAQLQVCSPCVWLHYSEIVVIFVTVFVFPFLFSPTTRRILLASLVDTPSHFTLTPRRAPLGLQLCVHYRLYMFT